MRELVLDFTKDTEWLPSVTQDMTDAIHVELTDIEDPDQLAEAIQLGANWTFDFVEALSAGLVRGYGDERERWVGAPPPSALRWLMPCSTATRGRSSGPADAWDTSSNRLTGRSSFGVRTRMSGSMPRWRTLSARRCSCSVRWARECRSSSRGPGYALPGGWGRELTARLWRSTRHDVDQAREFVLTELGRLVADDDHFRRLSARLRVYLEENMGPSRSARRLGVHEHTITNRIRAAQELLPHPIERRICELQVALRLIRLARAPLELS